MAIISFREFLEAFLIVGMFLGISRKLKLKKKAEIIFAAALGICLSLLLATGVYFFGDHARNILTERSADFLESYLMIFSGLFIAYVVFSLHDVLHKSQAGTLVTAHKKLQQNVFDISLFFTIIFLVIREGFEIALFTASTSLFSSFLQNIYGLLFGFLAAILLGTATFFAYIKFPIRKVFKATEYLIIILGASLVQNGVTKLFESHFDVRLSNIIPIPLKFLPDGESVAGHMFKSFFGIDREFSLGRLLIMISYVLVVYLIFLKKRQLRLSKDKMKNKIQQTVYLSALPHQVFESLMDEKKHASFTSASAKIDRKIGGKFSVWNGYATGTTKVLEMDKKIVQSWRADDWPKNIESEITIKLFPEKNKTKLVFTQINVPGDFIEEIKTGWQDYYWKPLEKFLIEKA